MRTFLHNRTDPAMPDDLAQQRHFEETATLQTPYSADVKNGAIRYEDARLRPPRTLDGFPLAFAVIALTAAIIPFGYWAALGGIVFLGVWAWRRTT